MTCGSSMKIPAIWRANTMNSRPMPLISRTASRVETHPALRENSGSSAPSPWPTRVAEADENPNPGRNESARIRTSYEVGCYFFLPIGGDERDVSNEPELDDQLLDGGGVAHPQNSPSHVPVRPQPLPV